MRRPVLIALALLLVPRVATAQDAEPISVDYQVPGTCPSSDWFLGEVRARTPRARAANAGERARVLVVRVEGTSGGYVGRLTIDDAGTRSTPRELRGATCAEVASALALIGALAVDPEASTAPRPAPPESEPPPPGPAPSPPPSASPSASAAPSPPAPSPVPAPLARPSSSSRTEAPLVAVGASAELAAWSGPVASLRLFGDLMVGHPTFRLAFARSLEVERAATVGAARLTWTTVSGAFCPIRIALVDDVLDLRPCVELAGGVLDAEGIAVRQPTSRSRPWLTAAAHGRLVWALARAFALEVEGGAMAPFFRESFFFEPAIPVYEAPAVAGFGRFAAAVRFP